MACGFLACRVPEAESYPLPEQAQRVSSPLPNVADPAIVLDEVTSHGQIWHGFHPIHPVWLDGRWMLSRAEIELSFDPTRHRKIAVEGLYEDYQLRQTGPVTLSVANHGVRLMTATVSQAGNFRLESPLPQSWRPEPGIVRIQLEASPAWRHESGESFTLTLISVSFEGDGS